MTQVRSKQIFGISIGILLIGLLGAGLVWEQIYRLKKCNFRAADGEPHGFYVYPGTTTDSLMQMIGEQYEMQSALAWRIHSHYYHFDTVRAGYYHFPAEMGSQMVIFKTMYGHEDPVTLHFKNNIRTRGMLAERISRQLLLDSTEIAVRLDSLPYLEQYGLNHETAVCLFIPNSYEVYWTISADELFARMAREYNNYWSQERLRKAAEKHLSPTEVATLASIVSSETHREAEWPEIASLYLHRLEIGMRLQADPTVIFGVGDFTIRRVLTRHLLTDSPYNTYLHTGLPPGPIRLATANAMDAVLNAPKSSYLYMCANPDFSGTHVFTSNYMDHMRVARQYQRELNRRKIK